MPENVLYALRTEGFAARWMSLGDEALEYLRAEVDKRGGGVDLVILDIGLPDTNLVEVCKAIRRFSQVPIVFLTARAEEIDRVVGLEIWSRAPAAPRKST